MKCTKQTAPEMEVIIIKAKWTVICKLTEVESAILFYRSYERSITLRITGSVHCDSRQQPLELKEFLHKGCLRCNHMAFNSIVLTIAKNGQMFDRMNRKKWFEEPISIEPGRLLVDYDWIDLYCVLNVRFFW